MIRFTEGNLLEAQVDALVNTVNEVGVMGKGIALMFKEAFPEASRSYQQAAKRGDVTVGRIFATPTGVIAGPKWILHFPTKKHWRSPSELEWVRDGLEDLARVVDQLGIRSVAVPPLGCGHGGLEWLEVRKLIDFALADLTAVDVVVYQPTAEYHAEPKSDGAEKLTAARALIVELVRRYSELGLECSLLEIQKLAWLFHRVLVTMGKPDPLDLRFKANTYGPYTDRLRHLLNNLDGSFLRSTRRIADARPFDAIWFDRSRGAAVDEFLASDEASEYQVALNKTAAIIDGFQSPFGLELLATVGWLLLELGCEPSVGAVRSGIQRWPGGRGAGKRKLRLFNEDLLGLAVARLMDELPPAKSGRDVAPVDGGVGDGSDAAPDR